MPSGLNDSSDQNDEQLLDLYLSLPEAQRQERFVSTLRAARFVGLSQRTMQLWIECGTIQAVSVGRKYLVDLQSVKKELRVQMLKRVI